MDNYTKQCPIDGGTCGQGGTCFVCENEALGSRLKAAEARIAELEAEYTATIEASARQAKAITDQQKRIAALEEALEPLSDIVTAFSADRYDHHQDLVLMEAGDARRAAALLKEKE